MLLWTVLPTELVLADADKAVAYEEIEYNGVKMQVEMITPVQCRIVRILSTRPQDYLCSEIQPGIVLTYRPLAENL